MFAVERQKRILDILEAEGAVWVNKLSAELNVTEETIRRDLEKLEKSEALLRTHGGAVPVTQSNQELSLEKRKTINTEAKIRLAKEAVKKIISGDTVFLDASTTTFYIAKELKNKKNVTVVTNSIRIINELYGRDNIKVVGIGGFVSNNQSFSGSLAQNEIANNYFANKMFFSSRGVTADAGILESNEQECGVKKAMLKNSTVKYYLCDKSKIGRIGFTKLADFSDIDCLICEGELSEDFNKALKEANVEVINV